MLNLERLREIADGDQPFIANVLREYRTAITPVLASLSGALEGSDFQAVRHGAHNIKGSSRTVGAEAMAERACRLEEAALSQDPQLCARRVDELRDAWEKTCSELDSAA
ncbi:MAG: Hpt domain-containing protein [Armatimonadetes bacterium]|nr:Hpt domain-containing protein [Armatimonadota bacterium]